MPNEIPTPEEYVYQQANKNVPFKWIHPRRSHRLTTAALSGINVVAFFGLYGEQAMQHPVQTIMASTALLLASDVVDRHSTAGLMRAMNTAEQAGVTRRHCETNSSLRGVTDPREIKRNKGLRIQTVVYTIGSINPFFGVPFAGSKLRCALSNWRNKKVYEKAAEIAPRYHLKKL